MAVISKQLFNEMIDEHIHCSELHFWEPSCRKACLSPYFVINVMKGSAKFFLPVYLVKLLINYKKIKDLNFIKSLLIAEATSTLYGMVLASLLVGSICLLRNIFGRVYYYNIVFIPGLVSGLSLLVESRENQILDTLIFFNSFIEAVLQNIHFSVFKITKTKEAIMFMTVSAALMYSLENLDKKLDVMYFWFYTPSRKETNGDEEDKSCNHPNTCWKFCQKGFTKYFPLGYLVNTIRRTIPKMGVLLKKPQEVLRILFSKSNVKFGLFIGGYVAIYRILTCYLRKWGRIKRKFHGLIAGLVSGLTYLISPNIQVLVIGITTLLQILYANISEKLNIKNHFWLRQMLYMVCHAVLFHNKIFYPKSCPSYYKNMIDACTNDVIVRVYEKLISSYFPDIAKKHTFKYLIGA